MRQRGVGTGGGRGCAPCGRVPLTKGPMPLFKQDTVGRRPATFANESESKLRREAPTRHPAARLATRLATGSKNKPTRHAIRPGPDSVHATFRL